MVRRQAGEEGRGAPAVGLSAADGCGIVSATLEQATELRLGQIAILVLVQVLENFQQLVVSEIDHHFLARGVEALEGHLPIIFFVEVLENEELVSQHPLRDKRDGLHVLLDGCNLLLRELNFVRCMLSLAEILVRVRLAAGPLCFGVCQLAVGRFHHGKPVLALEKVFQHLEFTCHLVEFLQRDLLLFAANQQRLVYNSQKLAVQAEPGAVPELLVVDAPSLLCIQRNQRLFQLPEQGVGESLLEQIR